MLEPASAWPAGSTMEHVLMCFGGMLLPCVGCLMTLVLQQPPADSSGLCR